jgi:hypothetical protein
MWEYFQGSFDFNKTLLSPVGCLVLIHTKPATWRSWDFCAKEGYYIGLALDLYCCFKLVKSDTKSQVISDTVEFLHAYHTIPSPSLEDKIIHGLHVMLGTSRMLHLLQASPRWRLSPIYGICLKHGAALVFLLQPMATSCPPDVQRWPLSFLGLPLLSCQPWGPLLHQLSRLHHDLPASFSHCPLSHMLSMLL